MLKKVLRERWALLVLVALMVLYSAYFSALSIQRHHAFRTNASDLGQMDQALWNTLHGHLLEDTRPDGHQAPRLTDHVEPIFLPISLSFLVYDGVEAILVLQSIVLALGALPVFWIARRKLKSDLAGLAFAAMYLLFPSLEAANLAEFHAVTFAPAPLLLAYNYGEERAWKRFALFALVALAVKEDIALLVFMMAAWFAIKDAFQVPSFRFQVGKFRFQAQSSKFQVENPGFQVPSFRLGDSSPTVSPRSIGLRTWNLEPETWNLKPGTIPALIAALAVVWFVVAVFIIVPHFNSQGQSPYTGRYVEAASAPDQPALALSQPLGSLPLPGQLRYVLQLLASSGLIALFDPLSLLLGAPAFLLNLLANYPAQYSGTYHYSAPVAPYWVLAAIGGAAAARRWIVQRGWLAEGRALAAVTAPALAIALVYHAAAGYTPFGGQFFWPQVTPHQQLLARFTGEIPPEVPIATQAPLFPHLSHRRVVYRFGELELPADTQYVLLDVSHPTQPVDFRKKYLAALEQGFGIRDAVDGYILLERGLAQKELPDAFYSIFRAGETKPDFPVIINFADKIRFLGLSVRQDDWGRVSLRTFWMRLPGLEANNYVPMPFYPDDQGPPRADAELPLALQFWYPTMRWKEGEVIVADTLPKALGERAGIGVGVYFGANWENAEVRLAPHTAAPLSEDGDWVRVGELVWNGWRYVVRQDR